MIKLYQHFKAIFLTTCKKKLIIFVYVVASIQFSFAAPPTNLHYRSRTSGDWSAASTWEKSSDLFNWSAAAAAPDDNDLTINILLNHTVSIKSNTNLDQLTITGTLVFIDGKLSVLDGIGDDIIINPTGRFNVLKTGNANINANLQIANGAGINVKRGGTIAVGDGSNTAFGIGYELFATNAFSNWETGSVYIHNNNNILDLIGTSVLFPNSASSGSKPIFRIDKISATNTFLCGNTFGTLEVNTNLIIAGGIVRNIRDGLSGNSSILIQASSTNAFSISGPGAFISGNLTLTIDKDVNLTNGLNISAGANIKVTDISSQSFVLAPNQIFTVDGGTSAAIFDIGVKCNFNGSNLTTVVDIFGIFKTGNLNGLKGAGASILSPTIILRTNSTIEYNGTNQIISTLPSYYNLTLSNAGIKTSGPVTINDNGTLSILNNVTLLSNGNISTPTIGLGNLTMNNNARYVLTNGGTQPVLASAYNLQANSVIEFNGNVSQTIRTSGSIKIYNNIEVTGNSVGNSLGNILLKSNGTFKVTGTGIFTINNNSIQAAPSATNVSVNVLSGGVIRVGDRAGFNGSTFSAIDFSIINISLDPNSTIDYTGNVEQAITNADNLVYGNLSLSGSGVKFAPASILNIRGNFVNSTGTSTNSFVHNTGTVLFSGNTTQTYLAGLNGTDFYRLENSNATAPLIFNAKANIENELKLSAATAKITLNADITLRSTAKSTAAVARIVAMSDPFTYGNGRFVVERYLPGFKSWRLLSAPLQNSTAQTIHNSWQEAGSTIANFGVQISSPLFNAGTNGFDYSSPFPALKVWDAALNNYVSIANTKTTNIGNAQGYYLFVRGDRTVGASLATGTATTLRAKGKINTLGSQTFPVVPPMKFASIGNPYPSRISFDLITKSGIADGFTVWNPSLYGNYGVGGFEAYTRNANGDYVNLLRPGFTRNFIESGEAIFIQNNSSTNGSLSISENAKSTGSAVVSRNGSIESSIRILLHTADLAGADYITAGALINFDDAYSNDLDNDDFRKFLNGTENISVINGSNLLEVERRKMVTETDTIFLSISRTQAKDYNLQLVANDIIAPGLQAFLVDKYKNSQFSFTLDGATNYKFSVSGDAISYAADRFYIIFKQGIVVPLNFVSVDAKRNADKTVTITWKVDNENYLKNYLIENSADGINYQNVGIVNALNNGANTYNFNHNATSSMNLYRIKSIDLISTSAYSQTAKVNAVIDANTIQITPNPVKGGVINLQSTLAVGKYSVSLIDGKGAIVYSSSLIQNSSYTNHTLKLGIIAAGSYRLVLVDEKNEAVSTIVIIE